MVEVANHAAATVVGSDYIVRGKERFLLTKDAPYKEFERDTGSVERSSIVWETLPDPLETDERFAQPGLAGGTHDLDPTKRYLFRVPPALDGAAKGAAWDVAEQDRYELIGAVSADDGYTTATTANFQLLPNTKYWTLGNQVEGPTAPAINDYITVRNESVATTGNRTLFNAPVKTPQSSTAVPTFYIAPGLEFTGRWDGTAWVGTTDIELPIPITDTNNNIVLRGGCVYHMFANNPGLVARMPPGLPNGIIRLYVATGSLADWTVQQYDLGANDQFRLEGNTVNDNFVMPMDRPGREVIIIGLPQQNRWVVYRSWELSVDVTGVFTGAGNAYAALPTTRSDGSLLQNGDWSSLTEDDIGTGDAANPQYQFGGYVWDGTAWQFSFRFNAATYNVTTNGGADVLGTGNPGQWVQVAFTVPSGQKLADVTVPAGASRKVLIASEGVALIQANSTVDVTPVFAAATAVDIDFDIGTIGAWYRVNNPPSAYGRMWGTDAERTYNATTNTQYAAFLGLIQSGDIPAGVAVDNGDNTFTLQDWSGVYLGAAYDTKGVAEFEDYLTARSRVTAMSGVVYDNGGGGSATAGRTTAVEHSVRGDFAVSGTNRTVTMTAGGDTRTQPPTRFGRWVVKLFGTPTELAAGATLNITQDYTQIPFDVVANGGAAAIGTAVRESVVSILVPLSGVTQEINPASLNVSNATRFHLSDVGTSGLAIVVVQANGAGVLDITFTEVAKAIAVDTYQAFHGFFDDQPGATGYPWTRRMLAGTAIVQSGDLKQFTLAEGFTYKVRYLPVRGRANGQFIHVVYREDNAVVENFYPISDDDGNWAGGAGYERLLQVPTGAGAKVIDFWRFNSTGNGNHDAILTIEAVAKDNQSVLPELFPQYAVTVNGAANTTLHSGSFYPVEIALPSGKQIDQATLAVTNGATIGPVVAGDGSGIAIVFVKLNAGATDITFTDKDAGVGTTVFARTGVYRPTTAIEIGESPNHFPIATGLDLTAADALYIEFVYNSNPSGGTHGCWVPIADGNTRGWEWGYAGTTQHVEVNVTNAATGALTFRDEGSNTFVKAVHAFGFTAVGYQISQGFNALVSRTITANGAAPIDGGTGFEGYNLPVTVAVDPGNQIDQSTVAIVPAGAATITQIVPGDGSSNGVIFVRPGVQDFDITYGQKPAGLGTTVDRIISMHRPAEIDIANTVINTGHDLAAAAAADPSATITFSFTDTGETGRPWPIAELDINEGIENGAFFAWNHDNAYNTIVINNAATGELQLTDNTRNARYIASWVKTKGPVGYSVASGQVAATPVTLTVTLDGAPVNFRGTASNTKTVHELVPGELAIELPTDTVIVDIPAVAGIVTSISDMEGGRFRYEVAASTGNVAIDLVSGSLNSGSVLIATVDGSNNGTTVPLLGSFTMQDLFGRMDAGNYIPGQYQAIWAQYYEGEAERRAESQTLRAKDWVEQGYSQIYLGGHAGEYIILLQASATATSWTTSQGNTPNSNVRIYGIRRNTALPSSYRSPAERTITLDPAGTVTTFLDGSNTAQVIEGMPSELYVTVAAGNRLLATDSKPTIDGTGGLATVRSFSSGLLNVVAGSTNHQITLNQEAIPSEFIAITAATATEQYLISGTDEVTYDFTLPTDATYRVTVMTIAWDDDPNAAMAIQVTIMDGTTEVVSRPSTMGGNHNSGAWECMPTVIFREQLTAKTYTIRIRDIAGGGPGESSGIAIAGIYAERV